MTKTILSNTETKNAPRIGITEIVLSTYAPNVFTPGVATISVVFARLINIYKYHIFTPLFRTL